MKQFPKIIKIFFLIIFLVELIGSGLILTVGKTALAADSINLQLQAPIPGGPSNIDFTNNNSTKPIADYIRVIYKYAIGVVGILATVVMMIGGIMWMMSGGSPERAGEAKAYIGAALTGLVLMLCSYLILATVNPALTNFKISSIQSVEPKNPEIASEDNCNTKCPEGYSYDSKTGQCDCYGSGSHKECQFSAGLAVGSTGSWKCITSPFPGTDQCENDSQCIVGSSVGTGCCSGQKGYLGGYDCISGNNVNATFCLQYFNSTGCGFNLVDQVIPGRGSCNYQPSSHCGGAENRCVSN